MGHVKVAKLRTGYVQHLGEYRECPDCAGSGSIDYIDPLRGFMQRVCSTCKGYGTIPNRVHSLTGYST